jgi:hypothetical protein
MILSRTAPLSAAWKHWCDFLKQQEISFPHPTKAQAASPDGYRELYQRLRCFSDKHSDALDHLQSVLMALSKGKHLVESALAWDQPAVGPSGTTSINRTSRARGEQWRLVMAYGGFETVLEALVPEQRGSFEERFQRLTNGCALPAYEPLPSPNRQRADLGRWLGVEDPSEEHPILCFLKLQNGALRAFRCWVVEGQTVDAWPQAVQLAKALRHATAHGALSASKVHQWGLQAALGTLTDNLSIVVAAAIQRLAEPLR